MVAPDPDVCFGYSRGWAYRICMYDGMVDGKKVYRGMRFELISSMLVVLNTVTMMLYYWKSPPLFTYLNRVDDAEEISAMQRHEYIVVLDWINIGFTATFFLEM